VSQRERDRQRERERQRERDRGRERERTYGDKANRQVHIMSGISNITIQYLGFLMAGETCRNNYDSGAMIQATCASGFVCQTCGPFTPSGSICMRASECQTMEIIIGICIAVFIVVSILTCIFKRFDCVFTSRRRRVRVATQRGHTHTTQERTHTELNELNIKVEV